MEAPRPHAWLKPILKPLRPVFREVVLMSLFINIPALALAVFILQVYDRVVFYQGLSTLYALVIGVSIAIAFDFLLRHYSSDMTSVARALASGELVDAMTWNETAFGLKGEGVPVKFANPKEGALTWVCGLVLHSKAPEPDRAYELIDAMIDPDAGEYLIGEYGYGHSNAESFARLSAERLAELGFPKDPLDLLSHGLFFAPQAPELMTKINRDWEAIQAGG